MQVDRRILISGGGIAGLTLAFWLHRWGFEPTVVESAPAVRGGGYMIDFWGVGYDVVERMGVLEQVKAAHQHIPALEFVDERNRVRSRMRIEKLRELIGYRHFNLLRSALERVLYDAVRNDVDVRFGQSIGELRTSREAVEVQFASGGLEQFDLVIGADGLRSNTRRLSFGSDDQFEKFLGYYVASFTIDDYRPENPQFQLLTVPGKQIGLYPVGGGKLAAYFLFAAPENLGRLTVTDRKRVLREAFAGVRWETPRILEQLDAAPDFYFDTVSQIRAERWSRERVALVGDACQCVSLISGQGSALAMASAYVLAGELRRANGAHPEAFEKYERIMKPEISRKQQSAVRFAGSFVPRTRFGLFARDLFVRLMFLPVLSNLFVKQVLSDDLKLPLYE